MTEPTVDLDAAARRMDEIAAPLLASLEAARTRPASATAGWICVTDDDWRVVGRRGDEPVGLIDLRGQLRGVEVWEAPQAARAWSGQWNRAAPPADQVRVVAMAEALKLLIAAHVDRLAALGHSAPGAPAPPVAEG